MFTPYANAQASDFKIDFELFTDFRAGLANGEQSWLDQKFGKNRFGGNENAGFKLGASVAQVALLTNVEFNWEWSAFVHAKYDDAQGGPIDFVEAYVKYDPVPTSSTRYSFRAGLFFPHISRENVGAAWSSPYTISTSAANSWVGEEIRALGAEAKVSFRGETNTLDITGGLFGYNDAAGTLLAYRGWSFNDIVAGAFTQFPLADLPQIGPNGTFVQQPLFVEPVAELDERVGYYGAIDWSYNRNWQIGAFYYDNRADPKIFVRQQYGWHTRFWNFYAEGDAIGDVHIIAQYMFGNTEMGRIVESTGTHYVDMDFSTAFLLASKTFGNQRISARFDVFDTEDLSFVEVDNNNEAGAAVTIAHSSSLSNNDTIIFEYQYIDSKRVARRDIGFDQDQTQSIFQIAYRRRF